MIRTTAMRRGEIAANNHDVSGLLDTYLGNLFSCPHPWRARQMYRRYLRRIGGYHG